jgi:purine-binding chemotaxis protein CheW
MPEMQETVESRELHVVSFELREREYAVDLARVVEIIYFEGITPVPKSPAFIKGVIDLRGRVIPVLDLKEKLDLVSEQVSESRDPERPDHILIVKVRNRRLGLLVDRVREVVPIETDKIQAPHEIVRKHSEFLAGVCRTKGRLILLLDIEGLLNAEEKEQLGEVQERR